MKKIIFSVSTGMVGSKITETIDFDDNATDEEIGEAFNEWVWDRLDAYWKPATDPSKEGK